MQLGQPCSSHPLTTGGSLHHVRTPVQRNREQWEYEDGRVVCFHETTDAVYTGGVVMNDPDQCHCCVRISWGESPKVIVVQSWIV